VGPDPVGPHYCEAATRDLTLRKSCTCYQHPRGLLCTACGCRALRFESVPGDCTVSAYSVGRGAHAPALQRGVPDVLALIETNEGHRVTRRRPWMRARGVGIGLRVDVTSRSRSSCSAMPFFGTVSSSLRGSEPSDASSE
jgi:uncharacterized OB-fold protein